MSIRPEYNKCRELYHAVRKKKQTVLRFCATNYFKAQDNSATYKYFRLSESPKPFFTYELMIPISIIYRLLTLMIWFIHPMNEDTLT